MKAVVIDKRQQSLWRRVAGSCGVIAVCLLLLISRHAQAVTIDGVSNQDLSAWGTQVADEIDATLRIPRSGLYAESTNQSGEQLGGLNGLSFVWPASTQFRVLNSLAQLQPTEPRRDLRRFTQQLRARYWDNGYRSGAGIGDRFYDDNAHILVAYAEAYDITRDQVYLNGALETYEYLLGNGEDDRGGGGIYFKENEPRFKDSVATLQTARGAAMLHRITGESRFLEDADRLVRWASDVVQQPSGLYFQGFDIELDQPGGVELVNAAGDGISANIELYRSTGTVAYLDEARRIGASAFTRFRSRSTRTFADEGYWTFELIDAFNDLYMETSELRWLQMASRTMSWVHENASDPSGRYGLFWGRDGPQLGSLETWSLNDMASVARGLLDTSMSLLPADVNQDGLVALTDIDAFEAGWLADTSQLDFIGRRRAGDLNADGRTDVSDFWILESELDELGLGIPFDTRVRLGLEVPEPTAACLASVWFLLVATSRTSCSRIARRNDAQKCG